MVSYVPSDSGTTLCYQFLCDCVRRLAGPVQLLNFWTLTNFLCSNGFLSIKRKGEREIRSGQKRAAKQLKNDDERVLFLKYSMVRTVPYEHVPGPRVSGTQRESAPMPLV